MLRILVDWFDVACCGDSRPRRVLKTYTPAIWGVCRYLKARLANDWGTHHLLYAQVTLALCHHDVFCMRNRGVLVTESRF